MKVARIEPVDSDRFQRAHEATAWTYSLDSATLTNGLHQVTVRATDGARNVAKATIDVLVGTSPARSHRPPWGPAPHPRRGEPFADRRSFPLALAEPVAVTQHEVASAVAHQSRRRA